MNSTRLMPLSTPPVSVAPPTLHRGTEGDWAPVLNVHIGGYLNVMRAGLPILAEAGFGQVPGVTSGSGWRSANIGAYGCAKRAVAALTWQIGRAMLPGVTVNALSPFAATRMVTATRAVSTTYSGRLNRRTMVHRRISGRWALLGE
jgi:NADP-dependent 3-hydroxy acid dehydrogenase YdfG